MQPSPFLFLLMQLGVYEHELRISVVSDLLPINLLIVDSSYYMDYPQFPMLDVTLPTGLKPYSIPFHPKELNVINTQVLGYQSATDLPDGYYTLRYSIEPNERVYKTITYYKTDKASQKLRQKLIEWDGQIEPRWEETVGHIYLLLQQSQVLAEQCNRKRADVAYQKATTLIAQL